MSFFEEDLVDEPVRKKRHVEQEQSEQQGTVCDQLSKKWRSGEDGDDADSAPVLSRNASDRIGLRLLQQMHQSSTRGDASCRGSSKNGKMHVVEEYVPLSVGGFMQTTTESLDNLISVRPGDIMCLRCPGDVKTEASNEGNNTREAVGNNPPAAGGMSFVKEKELTEEERLYGRRVTCDMMHEIFEVSRVDSASNSLEAVFLDGTRKKLKIITVRPAGFVESELYKRWKADENSRPVRAVYSTPSAKDTELADDRSKNSQQETTTQARVPKPWWVMPRLIVRVVEETAGDLLGKKFIVKSINRKEGRIRLFSLNATPGDASGGADRTNGTEFHSEAADLAPIDVFGCDALETVVPRVGDQGLLVEGNMRGELVIVTSRGRGESGELNTIRVRSLTLVFDNININVRTCCTLMHLAVDPFLLRHEYCYCPNVVASQSLVTSTGVQHHLEPFISKKKHMSAYPPAKHRPACDWEERCLNEGGQRQSPFDVYVILDFEATCERGKRICVPEVIEFPMILLDALTGRTIAEFQQYVRPVVNPRLSDFCTELVGIRQETVDKADTFPSVFSSAMNFLQQNGCGDTPSSKRHLFITFGDWDLKTMLPLQLQACCDQGVSICVPPFLRRWCNIKRLMQQMLFQGVWQAGLRFIRDIPDMMNILSLEMQGRHHSGIDDCRNIAAAVAKLIQAGYVFAPTTDNSGLTPPNYPCAPLSSTGHMDNSLAPGGVPVVFDCASKVEGSDMTARKRRLSNGNVQAEARKRPFINIVKYEYPLRSLLGAAREDGNACYTPLSQEKMIGYSKALSRILRHRADKMGITITDTGYVLVEDLLRYAPFSGDPAALLHIAQVVETNDKQRFRMGYDDAGRVFVCANQGHSLPGVNPELVRIANVSQVPTAFHGTSFSAWKKIRACGYLSTMERQHIHFAKGVPGDSNVISGMRSSSEVVLALNVPLVLEDGIELWESANGVLLTPGAGNTRQLPLKYIASAVDRQTGESLFF